MLVLKYVLVEKENTAVHGNISTKNPVHLLCPTIIIWLLRTTLVEVSSV